VENKWARSHLKRWVASVAAPWIQVRIDLGAYLDSILSRQKIRGFVGQRETRRKASRENMVEGEGRREHLGL
jgi:hypothetical protein